MDKLKSLKEVNGEGWDDELVKDAQATKEERRLAAIEAEKERLAAEEAAKNAPPEEGAE